jgi:hypothetical protein
MQRGGADRFGAWQRDTRFYFPCRYDAFAGEFA